MPNQAAVDTELTVREEQGEERFAAIREEWNDLFDADSGATIFQSWEFQYHTWRIVSDSVRPLLVTVRDGGGRLAGLAPLGEHVRRLGPLVGRSLEFVSTRYPDYNDFLVRDGYQEPALSALGSWLRKNLSRWDRTRLGVVRENARACDERFLGVVGQIVRRKESGIAPYLTIDSGWESHEQSLGKKTAESVRYKIRKLFKRYGGEFSRCSAENLTTGIDALFDLHQTRMSEKSHAGAFESDGTRRAFRDMVTALSEKDAASIWTIAGEGGVMSALLTFEHGGVVSFYQSGYDPEYRKLSPGVVSHSLRIQNAIDCGAREYDFLSGSEPYKEMWATGRRTLYELEFGRPSWRAMPFEAVDELRRRLSHNKRIRSLYLRLKGSR